MKQPKRLVWIDYVKVFAIFFVVLVHVDCSPLCTKVLKAFLMPLFFILSGYLFSYERNPKYKPFALKRFRQIIIPYAWISAVTYLLWFFVLRKFGNNPNDAVAWYVPVAGTFAGMPPLLVHDIPLWSLVSFFVVEMIYYPLRKCLKSDIGIAAIAFLTAWAISSLIPDISPYLPFALAPSIAGLGFYSLGRLLRTRATHTGLGNAKSNLVALAALIAFVISLNFRLTVGVFLTPAVIDLMFVNDMNTWATLFSFKLVFILLFSAAASIFIVIYRWRFVKSGNMIVWTAVFTGIVLMPVCINRFKAPVIARMPYCFYFAFAEYFQNKKEIAVQRTAFDNVPVMPGSVSPDVITRVRDNDSQHGDITIRHELSGAQLLVA